MSATVYQSDAAPPKLAAQSSQLTKRLRKGRHRGRAAAMAAPQRSQLARGLSRWAGGTFHQGRLAAEAAAAALSSVRAAELLAPGGADAARDGDLLLIRELRTIASDVYAHEGAVRGMGVRAWCRGHAPGGG